MPEAFKQEKKLMMKKYKKNSTSKYKVNNLNLIIKYKSRSFYQIT